MRYVLTLTIGLLAALAAPAATASADDYHRSHRFVEGKHSYAHHKVKRRAHYRNDRRYRARRHYSWGPYRSRIVIVLSPNRGYRVARRTH